MSELLGSSVDSRREVNGGAHNCIMQCIIQDAQPPGRGQQQAARPVSDVEAEPRKRASASATNSPHLL